jgi:hypothetical protein
VDQHKVLAPNSKLKLAKGLHKRHALNVADGAAKLNDADVGKRAIGQRRLGNPAHPVLNLVGHVRHN